MSGFAVAVTDLLRMKPLVFENDEVTWRHIAASCAVPGLFRQYWIDGRLCSDGGLLNPLPVWAAVQLGATHIVAVHAGFPQIPGWGESIFDRVPAGGGIQPSDAGASAR